MPDQPFRSLTSIWADKIDSALRYKRKHFSDAAEEAVKFYNGPHDFIFEQAQKSFSFGNEELKPEYRMTVNKVSELVQLYGPILYHRNPIRLVRPRQNWTPPRSLIYGMPESAIQQAESAMMQMQQAAAAGQPVPFDPMQQQLQQQLMAAGMQFQQITAQAEMGVDIESSRAELLERYLRYTPNELNLKEEMRKCIVEALIKGMGVMETTLYQEFGSPFKMVGSFYRSVDDIVFDPDMDSIEDAKWMAIRCIHPVYEVEREYGLEKGALKGAYTSSAGAAVEGASPDKGAWAQRTGRSHDLCVYWKIYSRSGVGQRLAGANKEVQDALEQFGDYAYLVVAKDVPYPLNLPPSFTEQPQVDPVAFVQEVHSRLEWPTPFWADGEWPITPLSFNFVPNCVYPMSPIAPAMGEQIFLDFAYSFLAGKVRHTCRDFIAMPKGAAEDMKSAILKGKDLTLLEIETVHKNIAEAVQFLQHPPMNKDILEVLQMIERNFERRTGLTELMYGESAKQLRSAGEAALKGDMMRLRPDDMAERVEHFSTILARKEAIAARWHLTQQDIAPVLGPVAAEWWAKLVQNADIHSIVRELEYRIEAGSSRKPNRDLELQNTSESAQFLLPLLQTWAQQYQIVEPLNEFLRQYGKARDWDVDKLLLPPPPPPQPDPKQQAEAQGAEQKLGHDEARFQQEMRQDKAKHKAEIDQMKAKQRATANGKGAAA